MAHKRRPARWSRKRASQGRALALLILYLDRPCWSPPLLMEWLWRGFLKE